MGKLVGLLLILVAVAAGAYYMMNQETDDTPVATKENKEALRPEEKVGVSTGIMP